MKKVLITGINGSGGSYLAEYLLLKKNINKIFGTYRRSSSLKEFNLRNLIKSKKLSLLKCDLNKIKDIKKIIKKYNFDIIFHLASDADVLKSFFNPREMVINNNNITINLLECLRLCNSKSKIMICSTSEVYGNLGTNKQKISENTKISPINPYAVSKTFQDLISQNYFQIFGLKIIITRMFTYLNARRNNLFASSFANQIVKIENKKQKFLNHGNLKSFRTILDIRDAMEAYYLAALKGKPGEIYNIGGIHKHSVGEILNKLIKLSNHKIITKLNKKLLRPKDIDYQIPDFKKFRNHTKWRPKYKIDESLIYMMDEIRKKFFFELNK
tara:strand:+ start:785 stop:1768 length:984 start_codon:yes stop_codon:yes gene_type:complete